MAGLRDAVTIDDAIEGLRRRKQLDRRKVEERKEAERRQVTLSPALDEWLKKEIPE